MELRKIPVGTTLYARQRDCYGKFKPLAHTARITKIGRKYITLIVGVTEFTVELAATLPYVKQGNYGYCLFNDEHEFNDYIEKQEQRRLLGKFFNYDQGLYKLTDDQVKKISEMIGL